MRIDPYRTDPDAYSYLFGLARHLSKSPLDATVHVLVELRVSQINGCAFCLGLHSDGAHRKGVEQSKLDQLAGWRESSEFNDQERAALQLAEEMARIGDGRAVSESSWSAAKAVFSEDELSALLYSVVLIQAWNVLNVAVALPSSFELPAVT